MQPRKSDPRTYYFGRHATEYDDKRRTKQRWAFDLQSLPSMIKGARHILDCPVGTGRFLTIYQSMGIEVTGLDISPHMLTLAHEYGIGTMMEGDATAIPLPDNAVDTVVCFRLFFHLQPEDIQAVAREFMRVASDRIVFDARVGNSTSVPFSGAIVHASADLQAAFPGWKITKTLGPASYPILQMQPH